MGLRDDFVNLLIGENGYREGRNADGTWNNKQKYSVETPGLEWSNWQPWCATFEAWGAHKKSMDGMWPMTASCYTAVQWWKSQGRWTPYPVLGGPAYFGTVGQDHTCVVWKYDGDWIWTVEGNTNDDGSSNGNGVYLRKRPRRGAGSPYGYGVPAYPEGTISADPNLGGTPSAQIGNGDPVIVNGTYTVKSGDSLSVIAEKFHVTLNALLNANPKFTAHPDDIQIGDVLIIPSGGTTSTPKPPAHPFHGRNLHYDGNPANMMYGADVLEWQKGAAAMGYTISCDGWFGNQSKNVALAIQKRKGLVQDAWVGINTWNATFGQ